MNIKANTINSGNGEQKKETREYKRLYKFFLNIFKERVGNILENGQDSQFEIGDVGDFQVVPEIKSPIDQINCYIEEDGKSLKPKFYDKFDRYFNIYFEFFKGLREKLKKEGRKKELKKFMISFLNLIYTFGDKLDPETFEDFLSEDPYLINSLTGEIISEYNKFEGNKRMQKILKKGNIYALEKGKPCYENEKSQAHYYINKRKLKEYVELSFIKEFSGISYIFNMFYFSPFGINQENLAIFAKEIDEFFKQILYLNQSGIAFNRLNPSQLIDGFLEKYFDGTKFEKETISMFKKLIKQREFYRNGGEKSEKYIEELLELRKIDLSKKGGKIDRNLSLEEIDYETFSNGLPGERSNRFLSSIFSLDKNNNIVPKKHNIPEIVGENHRTFKEFCNFIIEFYNKKYKYNFSEEKIKSHIEDIMNYVGSLEESVAIDTFYEEKGYSLLILRAWIKFFMIHKDNPKFEYEDYEAIFSKIHGGKEMILEGLDFDEGELHFIQISSNANLNIKGLDFQKALEFNKENTEKGHISTKDDNFKNEKGKSYFDISVLYLPIGNKEDFSFSDIVNFQKAKMEEINILLSSNFTFGSADIDSGYLELLKENNFINSDNVIDRKKLWNLKIVLKYALYVTRKLETFYENVEQEYNLLVEMNEELDLGLNIADIKSPRRSVEKALTKYDGNFYKNRDIVRANKVDISLNGSVDYIKSLLNKIKKSRFNDKILQVIISDLTGNPNELGPNASGYRDFKVSLRTKSGNAIELQFICEEMYNYKKYGINIEKEFLPLVEENNINLTEKDYKFFEKMTIERGIKVPKGLKKLISGYDFNPNVDYVEEEKVKSDFFYEIRRDCGNKKFISLFAQLESLYYNKIWGKIAGKLNKYFLENKYKIISNFLQ